MIKVLFKIAVLIGISFPAMANNSSASALFVLGAIGGSANVGAQGAYGRLPEELKDWTDVATQVTSRLSEQCGLLVETKLVRTGRLNFLFLGIRNESAQDVFIGVDRARAVFQGGRERYFLAPDNQRTLEIKKGWYSWGFLPFPRKSDFKGQSKLDVAIPVKNGLGETCELKSSFERNPNVEEQAASNVEAPVVIVSMGIGGLSKGGRLRSALSSETGGGLDFYFAGFRQPDSGRYLQMSVYSTGDVKDSSAFGSEVYTSSSMVDLSIGKAWRIFHGDKTSSYFNVGPSIAVFSAFRNADQNSQRVDDSKSGLGLYASYTLDYRYAREYFGYFRGDYSVGLTLFGKYYPQVFSDGNRSAGVIGLSFEILRGGE